MRLITTTMASTLSEDREVVDRIQRGSERSDQLAASAQAAQAALQTAAETLRQLERERDEPLESVTSEALAALEREVGEVGEALAQKSKRGEELRVEKVKIETRLMMIRKSLVRTRLGSDA